MVKRLWFVITAAALAGVFLGCQSDVTEPAGATPGGMDELVTMIQGYVTVLGTPQPIAGAKVWAQVDMPAPPSIIAGSDYTDNAGWYEILGSEEIWAYYEGYDIHVYAEHKGYRTGEKVITAFSPDNIPYRVDFELVPE
jgi:hypothetical protein